MSPLLVKAGQGQTIVEVTPASAGWTHVGFAAHRLQAGEHISLETGRRELCLVVLTGTVTVRAGDHVWEAIGKRASVFEDVSPYAVYVPLETTVRITAVSAAEVALCSAPATTHRPARLIEPSSMTRSVRGKGANTRYVCDILPQTEAADGLLVVEVVTPSGHSSSYPPHKHDSDNIPTESSLEETYYHRLHPEQGFAYQRVYTDDRSIDEAMAVENHDVVMVPRGYHPVTVPYGYDGYYLNVMAGPKRVWHFKNDPAHDWLMTK
ncbi:5-deoxy-glucuronate isomerase [Janthinobacterium agaricidamnosum]|uniref:5-deoxy-glucuronate isomerase n=1 Tax=Janthinobacterium agaricidamnosum TaxID=55508 RepID=A0A3G2E6U3_9BURK|nr:5-deoxy-glucuronate isomerase [Janthinobacterium agaricidamnosum]AYM76058.1 5-deoxy-glucuronate isomerase [Janthinobacterium agaricidamnosum]